MESSLRQFFPQIPTEDKIKRMIKQDIELKREFDSWDASQQKLFIDRCTGKKGFFLLSDVMFKEVMNADAVPEKLEDFLTEVLMCKVHILKVLQNEESNIEENKAMVSLDFIVQFEDGSLANVEIQRIGYKFPGERCACYSSDLLLRQYKRVRGQRGKDFTYRDIKKVYTIVIYEKSPKEFKAYPENYIHKFSQKSDTGLELNLLQEYTMIPLDIFRNIYQNKGIENKLGAWLVFFTASEPNEIISLIKTYPEFQTYYEDVYNLCLDMRRLVGMFSKELRELDKNTVALMIDEMSEKLENQADTITRQNEKLENQADTIIRQNEKLEEKDQEINKINEKMVNAIKMIISQMKKADNSKEIVQNTIKQTFSLSMEEAVHMVELNW